MVIKLDFITYDLILYAVNKIYIQNLEQFLFNEFYRKIIYDTNKWKLFKKKGSNQNLQYTYKPLIENYRILIIAFCLQSLNHMYIHIIPSINKIVFCFWKSLNLCITSVMYHLYSRVVRNAIILRYKVWNGAVHVDCNKYTYKTKKVQVTSPGRKKSYGILAQNV